MKRTYIFLVTTIIALIVASLIVQTKYDKTYKNLNLVEYKDGDILKKNTNVIVSGKIKFSYNEIYDKDYKIKFPFPFIKRIKNVADSSGWKDEEPIYIINKGNINGLHLSENTIKNMCNDIVKHNTNYKIEDSSIEPYFYSDSDYPFFTKTNEEGLWRIRYYTKEFDKDKKYTYIGKWTGKELVLIKGIDNYLFEGEYSKLEIENINNSFKILLTSLFIATSIVLFIVLIVMYYTEKRAKK